MSGRNAINAGNANFIVVLEISQTNAYQSNFMGNLAGNQIVLITQISLVIILV
jgi:hypothetical protein